MSNLSTNRGLLVTAVGIFVGSALLGLGLILRRRPGVGGVRGLDGMLIRFGPRGQAACPHCAAELELDPGAPTIRASADAYNQIRWRLEKARQEGFWLVSLDARNKILDIHEVCRGGDKTCLVDSKTLFRRALAKGAQAVIIAHNHPSGDPSPSHDDELLTRRLAIVGAALSIPVVDHLVVARSGYYSFADEGRLARIKELATSQLSEVVGTGFGGRTAHQLAIGGG